VAPLDARSESTGDAYLDQWAEISRSMEEGVSWSGHERNVAWLNARDGTFVEASSVAGFDQVEDGRVVCKTDWDRDGDVDLWLRSRNGVTLRYLENQANPEAFVEVSGLDRATTLELELALDADDGETGQRRTRVMALPATDGYLSAPSRRVTLALPVGQTLVGIGGQPVPESGPDPESRQRRFAVREGRFIEMDDVGALDGAPRPVISPADRGALAESALPTRTVLRSSLPLPPERLTALGVPHEREPNAPAARLLVVRSSECPTCESVLPSALAALSEGSTPVEVVEFGVSLNIESTDPAEANSAAALRTIVSSVLSPPSGPGSDLALPLSVLLDATGAAHVIYQGDLDAGSVSQDAILFVLNPVQAAFRSSWGASGGGSRWFHGSPRSFASLRSSLASQGLESDEHFYAAIARRNR
jgi:hypothetical protein